MCLIAIGLLSLAGSSRQVSWFAVVPKFVGGPAGVRLARCYCQGGNVPCSPRVGNRPARVDGSTTPGAPVRSFSGASAEDRSLAGRTYVPPAQSSKNRKFTKCNVRGLGKVGNQPSMNPHSLPVMCALPRCVRAARSRRVAEDALGRRLRRRLAEQSVVQLRRLRVDMRELLLRVPDGRTGLQ